MCPPIPQVIPQVDLSKYITHIRLGDYYKFTPEQYDEHRKIAVHRANLIAEQTATKKDLKSKRERVLAVAFSPEPLPRKRNIDTLFDHKIIIDSKREISLAQDKTMYPSIFDNEFVVAIKTNKRIFTFSIYERYKWNNADIIGFVQILALCSKDDRRVVLASGLHDFMLEYKQEIYRQFKEQDPTLTVEEYRWITSETFRRTCYSQGMGPVKSKVMSNIVDFFQKHCQKKKWVIYE